MKSPDFDKNIISPDVPCGHFALGTLSEACLKDVVVDVTARQHKLTKISKKQYHFLHENQNSIITCHYFGSMKKFQRVRIYILLDFRDF